MKFLGLAIAAAAGRMGIKGLVIPADNVPEAAVVKGIAVFGFKHLSEIGDFLNSPDRYLAAEVDGLAELERDLFCGADLHDVKGQAHARRALEIAAAGGHNLVLSIDESL